MSPPPPQKRDLLLLTSSLHATNPKPGARGLNKLGAKKRLGAPMKARGEREPKLFAVLAVTLFGSPYVVGRGKNQQLRKKDASGWKSRGENGDKEIPC